MGNSRKPPISPSINSSAELVFRVGYWTTTEG